jgi:DNA polymerase elongation subunit (family B)
MTIRGVLLARRDNCSVIRDMYQHLVRGVMEDHFSFEEAVDMIMDRLIKMLGTISCAPFSISKSIGNTTDYKIRPLPEDPVKRRKRLNDLNISEASFVDHDPNAPGLIGTPEGCRCTGCECYSLRSKPPHVQLVERMRRRGSIVENGSRVEYVVTRVPGETRLAEKMEDPVYQKQFCRILPIDHAYYLRLMSNPVDELLSVVYNRPRVFSSIRKTFENRSACLEQISRLRETIIRYF